MMGPVISHDPPRSEKPIPTMRNRAETLPPPTEAAAAYEGHIWAPPERSIRNWMNWRLRDHCAHMPRDDGFLARRDHPYFDGA